MSNVFTQRPGAPGKGPSMPGGSVGGLLSIPVILAGVAAFVVWMSYTPIDEGEVGVKLREVLFAPPALNAYSKDTQVADVKVSVNYAVDPKKAIEVYSRYGAGFVETIISPVLNKRFKEVFGRYDSREIVNKRKELGDEVETSVRQNIPDGIVIKTVQIENIDFSDTYEAAIEAAAQAEAMVRKARQELEQKKVDAERVVVQANADAQARVAAAKAEADAIRLKGEAEAAAIKAKADALRENPNLVALTATEKWDGKLPTTFVPGSAIPFIQVPRGAQ
jgi:regulator of protease activity HflC (stomatin/prohibitin superfamily)